MPRTEPPVDPPQAKHEFERDAECEYNEDGNECGWHGTVTVYQMHDHGEEEWECPRCGWLNVDQCTCGGEC